MVLAQIDLVDHPLIITLEAVLAVAVFRLYVALRSALFPLPQLVLGLAMSVMLNLTARAQNVSWFWVADIIMFGLLCAVAIAAIFSLLHKLAAEEKAKAIVVAELLARGEPAKVIIPETSFFDRWQIRFVWGVGLVVVGVLVSYIMRIYMERDKANTEVQVVAIKEKANTNKLLAKAETANKADRQAFKKEILKKVDTLEKMAGRSLDNQEKILKDQQPKPVRKPANNRLAKGSKSAKRPDSTSVISTKEIKQTPANNEPGLFKRLLKRITGKADTSRNGVQYIDEFTVSNKPN